MLCKVSFSFPLTPYAVLLTCEILRMSVLVSVTIYSVISFFRKYRGILEKIILSFNRFFEHRKVYTNFKYSLLKPHTEIYFSNVMPSINVIRYAMNTLEVTPDFTSV